MYSETILERVKLLAIFPVLPYLASKNWFRKKYLNFIGIILLCHKLKHMSSTWFIPKLTRKSKKIWNDKKYIIHNIMYTIWFAMFIVSLCTAENMTHLELNFRLLIPTWQNFNKRLPQWTWKTNSLCSIYWLGKFHVVGSFWPRKFSSESIDPNETKLGWNGLWVSHFQNYVQHLCFHPMRLLLLKIEISIIDHYCFTASQN